MSYFCFFPLCESRWRKSIQYTYIDLLFSRQKGIPIPRLADPIAKSDIEYYSRLDKRGYLALRAAAGQLGPTPQPESTATGEELPAAQSSLTDQDPANEKGKGDHGVTDVFPEEDIPATKDDLRGGI